MDKLSARCVLHVINESEQVGLALYSLSVLLESYSMVGNELDGTLTKGLSHVIDGLGDRLVTVPHEYSHSIGELRAYSGVPA